MDRLSGQELSEVGEHRRRPLIDVEPGVAPELVATGPRFALALAVLLPGVTAVVIAVAVELDGEMVLGPAAVDVSTIDSPIHFWLGKGGVPRGEVRKDPVDCPVLCSYSQQ
jgi:hypothetical protein